MFEYAKENIPWNEWKENVLYCGCGSVNVRLTSDVPQGCSNLSPILFNTFINYTNDIKVHSKVSRQNIIIYYYHLNDVIVFRSEIFCDLDR